MSHPLEPVSTTFILIALLAGTYDILRKSFSTSAKRFDMIECEFVFFISFSAINTLTIEVLFHSSSPEPF
tara:strand:- start:643 stop:852 length:210 start_codon:yes stop_codon:yes gene_type:complete